MRNKRKLIFIFIAAAVAAVLLTATGCGSSDPSGAAEEFLKAAQDKDCDKMVDMIDLEAPELSSIGMSKEDLVKSCQQDTESGGEVIGYKVVEEKIDGDKATVKVEVTTKDGESENTSTTTFSMTKRESGWKLGAGI